MNRFQFTLALITFSLTACATAVPPGKKIISKEEIQVVGSVDSARSLAKEVTILKSDGGRV